MQAAVRRKLEALGRVRDFLRSHPYAEPSHTMLAARYEALLVRAMGLAVEEQSGRLEVRAATRHRQALRRELARQLMRYVARVATVAARERPALLGRFRTPSPSTSNAAFLARGWDILNQAREHQELLASHGLAGGQIDDLATALTQFESATERGNAGRRLHTGCRAELERITRELAELVRVLDVLNQRLYQSDSKVLAAWNSARNVEGPFRSKPAGPEPTAPPPGELGRAA